MCKTGVYTIRDMWVSFCRRHVHVHTYMFVWILLTCLCIVLLLPLLLQVANKNSNQISAFDKSEHTEATQIYQQLCAF